MSIGERNYRQGKKKNYLSGPSALLVCTLLPGTLDSYRDRINSLLVSIWVFLQLNISLRVQVFIPGFLKTPDNFNLFGGGGGGGVSLWVL